MTHFVAAAVSIALLAAGVSADDGQGAQAGTIGALVGGAIGIISLAAMFFFLERRARVAVSTSGRLDAALIDDVSEGYGSQRSQDD